MRVRWIPAIVFFLASVGCFSSKSTAPSAVIPPVTSVSQGAIFPHKSDWKDPAQHGVYVKDQLGMDFSTCLGCHTDGNLSGGAPSCYSCHKVFPHNDPAPTKATHGAFVVKFGKSACATQCHGTDLKGGLSGVSCNKCHEVYPHADAWVTPAIHGPAAKGDLKLTNKCNLCHGDDWNGGNSQVSCVNCHKGIFPHPQGWASPDQHGAFVQTNGTGKCATQCHGPQLDGGLSGVSCKDCHKVWPHPTTGWLATHGDTARSIGLNGCIACHKITPPGGMTGVTCDSCHNSLPLHSTADWSQSGHGKFVMQNPTALTDPKGCILCHGADFNGGKQPSLATLTPVPGCTSSSCHASYPTLHKTAAGAPAWNTYAGHGTWVLDQVKVKDSNVLNQINDIIGQCKLCHGDDLKGGNTGKSCYTCHTTFPHAIDPTLTPWLAKHGPLYTSEIQSGMKVVSCATANCHGVDLKGQPNGKVVVKGCVDCHLQMPHPIPQLPLKWDHGKSIIIKNTTLLDVNQCVKCHGSNWTGGNLGPSCYQCHNNYPLPHRQADGTTNAFWGQNAPSGKTLPDHASLVIAAAKGANQTIAGTDSCKICHGADLSGGASGVSCNKCHAGYPHTADWTKPIADPTTSHGEYVIATAKTKTIDASIFAQTSCALAGCHAAPLAEYNGGLCNKCHDSFPTKHLNAQWATKTGHGAIAKISKTECLVCHKDSGTAGPNEPPACTSCHVATVPGGGPTLYDLHSATPAWYAPNDPYGGAHGPYVVKNGASGCLTPCHGYDGKSGFVDPKFYCTTCHAAYPHYTTTPKDPNLWLGPTGNGYSKHGQAVISTQPNPTNYTTPTMTPKDWDYMDTAKFAECAKCHGPAVAFSHTKGPATLTAADKTITLPNGAMMPRCTNCHLFPHTTFKPDGSTSDSYWFAAHMSGVTSWFFDQLKTAVPPLSSTEFAKQTCAAVYDATGKITTGGCHTDGPKLLAQKINTSGTMPPPDKNGDFTCSQCHTITTY